MRNIFLSLMLLFLAGCATKLTPAAQQLTIISEYSPDKVQQCLKIGEVTGYSRHGFGNDVGIVQATVSAKNKAGAINGSDTLAFTNKTSTFNNAQVSGFVYNCSQARGQSGQVVNAKPTDPKTVYGKAQACQEKGGVWVNDQCVLKVD
ncbi:MAG: DUF4156 domain-containing protein [Proteobacteria bacterium]|nr:DUF4156 domain-containing protein [Pseudomonadota bacterium]MBU1686384.1 DUF4156 domain-containing protein [Pseudomonadota bacterium]